MSEKFWDEMQDHSNWRDAYLVSLFTLAMLNVALWF